MHTGQPGLSLRRRLERLECRLKLAATGMKRAGGHMEKDGGSRVTMLFDDVPGTLEPQLPFVEVAGPNRQAPHRSKCGCEDRMAFQAVALGQGHRRKGALARCRNRNPPRREALMRPAYDLEVGPGGHLGERGSL